MLTKRLPLIFMFICYGVFLTSCTGYRLRYNDNPFAQYGIKSVSIPMFLNQTTLAGVSGPMTREIFLQLSNFNKLKVYSGNFNQADAMLVGIIKSPRTLWETVRPVQSDTFGAFAPNSRGKRSDFYITTVSNLKLRLQLVLIKRPTAEELEFIKTSMGDKMKSPKILFNKTLAIDKNFNREIFDYKVNLSDGQVVNMTQNLGAQKRAIKSLAKIAALSFKEVVLDAF